MQKGVSEYRKEELKEGLSYFGCFWLIVDVMCAENGKKKPETETERRKRKSERGRRKWNIENSEQKPVIRIEKKTEQWRFYKEKSNFGWTMELLVYFAGARIGVTQCSPAWGRGSIA